MDGGELTESAEREFVQGTDYMRRQLVGISDETLYDMAMHAATYPFRLTYLNELLRRHGRSRPTKEAE